MKMVPMVTSLSLSLSLSLSPQDDRSIEGTVPGCIASYYYLHHKTMRLFCDKLHSSNTMEELLMILCVR